MKAKITISLYLLLSMMHMACQNKKENLIKKNDSDDLQTKSIIDNKYMEKILVEQLHRGQKKSFGEIGLDIPIANEKFEISDFELAVEIGKKKLIAQGYQFIGADKFSFKIKEIFDRTIDLNSDKKFLYINYFDKCDKIFNYYPYNGTDYSGTYIVKKECFITDFYFIPELIDYQNEFPQTVEIENKIITARKKDGEVINIKLWKDDKNLNEERKKNVQTLVARNMYLFNDSRAFFKWLILNDENFMSSLVTTFGYYEDKELVKWVVDKTEFTNKNIDEVNKIIYNKKCDGKIVFDQQLLNILVEDDAKATQFYELVRYDYIDWLLSDKNNTELTFSQKAEIIARIHSFIYSHAKGYRTVDFMGKFAEYNDSDNKYSKEFKLKNYYNIPEFEKQWKQAKIDGDGISLPGEE